MARVPRVLLSACVVMVVSASSCGDSTGPVLDDAAREEAQQIAIYVSGELEPPVWLSYRIRSSLHAIRAKYGDEYEMLNEVRFEPPWVPSRLILAFDAAAAARIVAGEYHEWDSVNRELELIDLEVYAGPGWYVLDFAGMKHPWRLLEYYRHLPGVLHGEPDWSGLDGPNIFPNLVSGQLTYLFWDAWCPPPARICRTNDYIYLVQDENGLVLKGAWQQETDPFEPRWWPEASVNMELYDVGSRSP